MIGISTNGRFGTRNSCAPAGQRTRTSITSPRRSKAWESASGANCSLVSASWWPTCSSGKRNRSAGAGVGARPSACKGKRSTISFRKCPASSGTWWRICRKLITMARWGPWPIPAYRKKPSKAPALSLWTDCSISGSCRSTGYHMRQATVRDLRCHFPEIERALQEGQEIQITKRKRVIARLVPEQPAHPPQLPDFLTRLRVIYGDKKLKVTGAQRIREERDEGYWPPSLVISCRQASIRPMPSTPPES